jgi:hypothetical protein
VLSWNHLTAVRRRKPGMAYEAGGACRFLTRPDGYRHGMIELGHIATGLLLGRRRRSALRALAVGIASHALFDITPHGEVNDRNFELASTVVGIGLLAARRGVRSPLVWGAIGAVLPDGEHVLPRSLRPNRDLFPTHRFHSLHSSDGPWSIPAAAQVVLAGAVIGAVAAQRRA